MGLTPCYERGWALIRYGHGRIVNGDCLDVMGKMPVGKIGMVFADLPYGTTNCAWDTPISNGGFWDRIQRVCVDSAAVVLTATMPFGADLISSNRSRFKQEWIWVKSRAGAFVVAKFRAMQYHENVLVFNATQTGKLRIYRPQMEKREKPIIGRAQSSPSDSAPLANADPNFYRVYEDRHPSTVLKIDSVQSQKSIHPTQKPVELIDFCD